MRKITHKKVVDRTPRRLMDRKVMDRITVREIIKNKDMVKKRVILGEVNSIIEIDCRGINGDKTNLKARKGTGTDRWIEEVAWAIERYIALDFCDNFLSRTFLSVERRVMH